MRQQLLQDGQKLCCVLIARTCFLAIPGDRPFNNRQISERQFGHDGFNVGNRVNAARHMDYVFIVKTSNHVDDGIGFPDVSQELVPQTFALRGARYQTRNINKFDNSWLNTLRLHDLGQSVQTRIRHFHNTHIRFNRAKRIVLGCNPRFGQGVEQGGFADVRQADDAAFEAH